jgi:polyisoprenoid-binding protein YceI
MRMTVQSVLAVAILGFCVIARADLADLPSGQYGLDKTHGYISFTYDHVGFSTPHIGFRSFELTLLLDSEQPENSSVEVAIDASSIDSRVPEFNVHLNGEEFFDTENFPEITFKSTGMKSTGADTYDVAGILTIKDVSRPVTLAATINKAADHPWKKIPWIGISAETTVTRSEWNLSRALPMVSDEVTIHISVEMPKTNSE